MSVATLPHRYPRAYKPGASHTGRELADFCFTHAREFCQTRIGKPLRFSWRRNSAFRPVMPTSALSLPDAPALQSVPGTSGQCCQIKHAVYRQTRAEGISDIPIRSAPASFSSRRILVSASGSRDSLSDRSQLRPLPGRAALLQGFLLRATNRHHFANRFHLVVRRSLAPANFSKLKRGILVPHSRWTARRRPEYAHR